MHEDFNLLDPVGQVAALRALAHGEYDPKWMGYTSIVEMLDVVPVDHAVDALVKYDHKRPEFLWKVPVPVVDAWFRRTRDYGLLLYASLEVLAEALESSRIPTDRDSLGLGLAARVASGAAGSLDSQLADRLASGFMRQRLPSTSSSRSVAAVRWELAEVLAPFLSTSTASRDFVEWAADCDTKYNVDLARSGRLFRRPHLVSSYRLLHGLFCWHLSGRSVFPPEVVEGVLMELEARPEDFLGSLVVPARYAGTTLGRALSAAGEDCLHFLGMLTGCEEHRWAVDLFAPDLRESVCSVRVAADLGSAPLRALWEIQERYGSDIDLGHLLAAADLFGDTPFKEFMEAYLAML